MKYTHLILSGNNSSKLDESIRISRKLFSIDRLIIVVPEGQSTSFKAAISAIKKRWKDVDIKYASIDDIELCALDLCDCIEEVLIGERRKDKDVIINISHANPTFAIAGYFCASILKLKIITVVDGEPEAISRVPFQELIPIRYAILAKIPDRVCNQTSLMGTVNTALEKGEFPDVSVTTLSPTNMSHHVKYLDTEEFLIRVKTGREKEIIITNLGRLMRKSYEILKI